MNPIPLGAPPRSRLGRLGVALTVGTVLVLVASAVAWASFHDDEPSDVTTGPGRGAMAEVTAEADAAMDDDHHQPLPPYAERYAAATPAQQQAADDLLADVRSTLAAYEDVEAAKAAGYRAPRRKRGLTHYLHPDLVRNGQVLDPAHPTGLVYFSTRDNDPVLLGAFFVVPAGTPAPMPAGDLVVWHSHRDSCPGFFATEAEPCLDARRMLHVWTADEVTLPGDRRGERQPITVRVVDPFAVPFRAGVEKVEKVDD